MNFSDGGVGAGHVLVKSLHLSLDVPDARPVAALALVTGEMGEDHEDGPRIHHPVTLPVDGDAIGHEGRHHIAHECLSVCMRHSFWRGFLEWRIGVGLCDDGRNCITLQQVHVLFETHGKIDPV